MTGYRLILPKTVGSICNSASDELRYIKGIVFDMDGTLTKPQTWMFGEMRRQVGVPDDVDILVHIADMKTEEEKHEAECKLRVIEEKAMREQQPTDGLLHAFETLHQLNVKTSICTRNVPKPVTDFCLKFLNHSDPFDNTKTEGLVTGPIMTREFKPPKPAPEPLLHICNSWGVDPRDVVMVGDSIDDMQAGYAAGCAIVLINHDDNHVVKSQIDIDAVVTDLNELIETLKSGILINRST